MVEFTAFLHWLAFLCFAAAAIGVPWAERVTLIAAGLALWMVTLLIYSKAPPPT